MMGHQGGSKDCDVLWCLLLYIHGPCAPNHHIIYMNRAAGAGAGVRGRGGAVPGGAGGQGGLSAGVGGAGQGDVPKVRVCVLGLGLGGACGVIMASDGE